MFGKIFEQIYDSSVAEDWIVRVVFQDLIILSDKNGVVDRTPESIARRTNVPLEHVLRAIKELEKPDPKSRSPEEGGIRIIRLDPHRDWGWEIVNYDRYRSIASGEQRREKTKIRTRKYRKIKGVTQAVTQCDAPVTRGDVFPYASPSASVREGDARGGEHHWPTEKEWIAYIGKISQCPDWYARDKWLAKESDSPPWRGVGNWNRYAERIIGWWVSDGKPTEQKGSKNAGNIKHNRRNDGVFTGVTDYGKAARGKLERQALAALHEKQLEAGRNGA